MGQTGNLHIPAGQAVSDVMGGGLTVNGGVHGQDPLAPRAVGDPPDHYYRFFGTGMVEIAGQDLTGRRYYADNISGYGFVNAELLPIMAERRAPVWTRVQWVSENGREMTTISVRLPLSEDGESVTGAVTANRFEKTGLNDA